MPTLFHSVFGFPDIDLDFLYFAKTAANVGKFFEMDKRKERILSYHFIHRIIQKAIEGLGSFEDVG
jgi:hypothetical protein